MVVSTLFFITYQFIFHYIIQALYVRHGFLLLFCMHAFLLYASSGFSANVYLSEWQVLTNFLVFWTAAC